MYIVKGIRERMVRMSLKQLTENRRTILGNAGGLFRERDALTVAEIMQAAGPGSPTAACAWRGADE
jgi:hypothetical protein